MAEILLVSISGQDRPGLTFGLSSVLAEHDVEVLDMGQAVIHENLALGLLIRVPDGAASYSAIKSLLFKAQELGVTIRFSPVSDVEYAQWVGQQVQERNVITLLGRKVQAQVLSEVSDVILRQGLNIEKIARLSQRVPIDSDSERARACMEFSVLGSPLSRDDLYCSLMEIASEHAVDISLQFDDMYRRNRRMVVFDMDSTLIEVEAINELARLAGVEEQVSAITARAMAGELDFKQSFRERLALLKGLTQEQVLACAQNAPMTEGADRLIKTLKKLGFTTVICSGGFREFGEVVAKNLGIDFLFANELEFEDGKLTGRVKGDIVDGPRKAELMRNVAEQEGLSLKQVIAVGDGANDLPMIQQAGLGIAFRAKPLVRASSKQAINVLGLDGILYLIGVRDRDLLREEADA